MNQPQVTEAKKVSTERPIIVCYCGLPEPFHDFTAVEHQTDDQFAWNPDEVELYPLTALGDEKKACCELLEKVGGRPGVSDRFLDGYLFEELSRFPKDWKGKKVLWPTRHFFNPQGREFIRYSFFVPNHGWGWDLMAIESELSDGWFVALYKAQP